MGIKIECNINKSKSNSNSNIDKIAKENEEYWRSVG